MKYQTQLSGLIKFLFQFSQDFQPSVNSERITVHSVLSECLSLTQGSRVQVQYSL